MPSGPSPFPYLQVQVAFASNPLSGSYTWVDVSASTRQVTIQRGRQHVLSNFEPGRLTVLLDGRNGAFDPTNTLSTYYPNVTINKRVQVLAWWNMLSATDGASIPTGQTLYNCTASANGQLTAQAAGNMVSSSASGTAGFPVTPGATYYHQELIQAAATTRACFATLWFYDSAGAWVASSSGAQVTDSASATVQPSASSVAPSNARYGSTGTTILSAASSEKHTNTQPQVTMASSTGTWYAGGPNAIFTGFTDAWTPRYKDNLNTDIEMTATDGLRLLAGQDISTLTNVFQTQAITDGATELWMLNDSAGTVASSSISTHNGTYVGDYTLALGGPAVGATSLAPFFGAIASTHAGGVKLPVAATINTASAYSVEAWYKTSDAGNHAQHLYEQYMYDGVNSASEIALYTLSGKLAFLTLAAGTASAQLLPNTAVNDGKWHQGVVTRSSDGLSYKLYSDGVLASSQNQPFAFNASVSTAIGWSEISYGPGIQTTDPLNTITNLSVANCALYGSTALSAAQVLNHYNLGSNLFLLQDSGARETAVLDGVGWPSADRSITTGQSNVQTATASMVGTKSLSYMQTVAQAENGALFINGAGKVVFHNRYTILTGPNNVSVATFGDNANNSAEINYAKNPTIALDNIDLNTQSVVTRVGGVAQTSSSSPTAYGMSTTLTESGLLITTDVESLARAQWNVGHYATPLTRVRGLTINVLADPTNMFPLTVFRELRDRITINRRPYTTASGWPTTQFSQDSYIEGITHNIDAQARTWTVDIACSPAETQAYLILNDTTFGVLNSTTVAHLAY